MAANAYRRHLLTGGIALVVNGLLFLVLPHFMAVQKAPPTAMHMPEGFRMINFLRFTERHPAPSPKHPENQVRPAERQSTPAPEQLKLPLQEQSPPAPEITLGAPALDITPRLAAGPAVLSPDSFPPAELKTAYDQTEVDQAPASVVKTRPVYPYRARRMNLSGEVRVRFLVAPSGRVRDIQIIRADPPDVFDRSVISALSSWRFAPGRLQGRPVATWVTTTIVFRLGEAG
jgi:periplasmic protein TonB